MANEEEVPRRVNCFGGPLSSNNAAKCLIQILVRSIPLSRISGWTGSGSPKQNCGPYRCALWRCENVFDSWLKDFAIYRTFNDDGTAKIVAAKKLLGLPRQRFQGNPEKERHGQNYISRSSQSQQQSRNIGSSPMKCCIPRAHRAK